MATELDKKTKALRKSGKSDPDRYRAPHPDIDLTGLDPATHNLRYGYRMQRDPGPGFSARILRTLFNIWETSKPLSRLAWLRGKLKGAPVEINPKRVLMAANKLAMTGDHARAIAMAEEHLPADLAHSAAILRANAALARADEEGWLQHVNAYLAHFDVAPIRLEGQGTVFDRLASGPLPPVTGGPLVSVIMPAWNAAKTVEKAARSILDQTWRNLELLIVDDASTDGTWSVLQRLAASDSRVKIARNKVNVGPYVSKNIALMQAKGAWITGHDADDWAHPNRISEHVSHCTKRNFNACMGAMLRVASNGAFVRLNKAEGFFLDGACRSAFISLMISIDFFRDHLGAWDAIRASGDSEILRRIERLEGTEVTTLQLPLMFCLDNPHGLTNDPRIGFSETAGLSEPRLEYRRQFRAFHQTASRTGLRLKPFALERPFPAPKELTVPEHDIQALINDSSFRSHSSPTGALS